jgi:hypothetical protein
MVHARGGDLGYHIPAALDRLLELVQLRRLPVLVKDRGLHG